MEEDKDLEYCAEFNLTMNHMFGIENCKICKKKLNNFNIPIKENKSEKNEVKVNSTKTHKKPLQIKSNSFLPKTKKGLNINVKPYAPKENENIPVNEDVFYEEYYGDSSDEELPDDEVEFAMLMMEKFKDCECCKGDIYHCKGETCDKLGACYCFIQSEIERDELEKEFDFN